MLDELFVRDHAVAMLDQIQEHLERFGFQLQGFSSTEELGETTVEPPLAEEVYCPQCAPHGSSSFCDLTFPAINRNKRTARQVEILHRTDIGLQVYQGTERR